MLTLRNDWWKYPAGTIAIDLASQVDDRTLEFEVWRHLIAAALQGLADFWSSKSGSRAAIIEQPRFTWRINKVRFVFVPEFSYDQLEDCFRFRRFMPGVTVLTPPDKDILLQKMLAAIHGAHVMSVSSAHTYISFRHFFSQADFRLTHSEAMLRLLKEYNSQISKSGAGDAIEVDLPPLPGLSPEGSQLM